MTQKQIDNLSLTDRILAPTPVFFQKLKLIGLSLAAVSAAIIAAPIALPSIVVTIAGYMALAGTVIGAVSQVTVES
jgi:ABC-type xylose transport system permease subunit